MIASTYCARVKAARDRLADNTQRNLSQAEIHRLAAEFYAKARPEYMLRRQPDDHAAVVRTTEQALATLTALYGRMDYGPVRALANRAIADLPIPKDSPSLPLLQRLFMVAFIEIHRAALWHLQGRTDYKPESLELREVVEQGAAAVTGRSVTDLIDA